MDNYARRRIIAPAGRFFVCTDETELRRSGDGAVSVGGEVWCGECVVSAVLPTHIRDRIMLASACRDAKFCVSRDGKRKEG